MGFKYDKYLGRIREGDSQASEDNWSLQLNNTVWVSKNGNDSTGERNNMSKPFLTISAAITAANAWDTIYVFPWTYWTAGVNININKAVNIVAHWCTIRDIEFSVAAYASFWQYAASVTGFWLTINKITKTWPSIYYVDCWQFRTESASDPVLVNSNTWWTLIIKCSYFFYYQLSNIISIQDTVWKGDSIIKIIWARIWRPVNSFGNWIRFDIENSVIFENCTFYTLWLNSPHMWWATDSAWSVFCNNCYFPWTNEIEFGTWTNDTKFFVKDSVFKWTLFNSSWLNFISLWWNIAESIGGGSQAYTWETIVELSDLSDLWLAALN